MTGYLISYSGVIATASGFLVGRIADYYKNDSKLLLHTGYIQVLSIAGLTYAPTLWGVILFLTPLGISNAIARVCVDELNNRTRKRTRNRCFVRPWRKCYLSMARMLSPALGGVMQEIHMSGPALLGVVCAAVGVLFKLLFLRKIRHHSVTNLKLCRNLISVIAILIIYFVHLQSTAVAIL